MIDQVHAVLKPIFSPKLDLDEEGENSSDDIISALEGSFVEISERIEKLSEYLRKVLEIPPVFISDFDVIS